MSIRQHFKSFLIALGLGTAGLVLAANAIDFFHAGNFKRMSHTGNTAGVATLASLPQATGTWGVGATAGLKGEVIQIDGKLLVSPGSSDGGAVRAPEAGEQVLLWASGQVAQWTEVALSRYMEQPAFESFVQSQAQARGLPPDQPFVFRVNGQFPKLRWHVVTGEPPEAGAGGGHGGHSSGHANKRTAMKVFHQPGAQGQLLGVYSGAALEGVVSHPGERFHVHYADTQATVSGHVDAYAVAEGAVLLLPAR